MPASQSLIRRSFLAALIVGFVSPVVIAPSGASAEETAPKGPNATQIVSRVQGFYDQAKTFKADFKQRYTIAAYGKTKDSAGTVTFQKPGKMSWRYASNGNRVVSDGKILKIYEQENKQMYEQGVDKSQYPAALSFLFGEGKLGQAFDFVALDAEKLRFKGGYVLLGTPREATPAYQKMLLYVDGATYQVRRVLLIDAQKNKNRFDFAAPRVNDKVPEDEFKFVPPPGTRVIRP
jgi:outer membrane lipoprotein carrier protein